MPSPEEISRQIAARQRQAIADANRGIIYARPEPLPPKPEELTDAELDAEWPSDREKRLAAEAKYAKAIKAAAVKAPAPAPTLPSPVPFTSPARRPQKPRANNVMTQKVAALGDRDRRCQAPLDNHGTRCMIQFDDDTVDTFCWRHRLNRRQYGDPRRRARLRPSDYGHLVLAADRYLRRHPPDQRVLDAVAALLIPQQQLRPREPGYKARVLVVQEQARWADQRYRKRYTHPFYNRPFHYKPRQILPFLIGVEAYIAERPRGWPGDSELVEKGYALIRLWKRPRQGSDSLMISASVLRGIGQRIRDSQELGVYVTLTANAILAEITTAQATKNETLAADARSREAAAQQVILDKAAARRATFDALPVPPEPGPQPIVPEPYHYWIQDVRYQREQEAWRTAVKTFTDYHRQKKEMYP